jgi:hypothetical protein
MVRDRPSTVRRDGINSGQSPTPDWCAAHNRAIPNLGVEQSEVNDIESDVGNISRVRYRVDDQISIFSLISTASST